MIDFGISKPMANPSKIVMANPSKIVMANPSKIVMANPSKIVMINYEGRSYQLESLPEEPSFETYERLWKIAQHCPKSESTYEQLVRISRLWAYKKKFGCRYSPKLEKLIKLF
jgi:hypothetical protein